MTTFARVLALSFCTVFPAVARADRAVAPQLEPFGPPRPLRTLLLPAPCPTGNCDRPHPVQPHAKGLRIVYLNFDGVTLTASATNDDARNNISAILSGAVAPGQTRTIPSFNPSVLSSTGGLSRSQIINKVKQDLYNMHAAYNVEFVTERPASGNYSMIVFGGNCPSVSGDGGCVGVALLDCGDAQFPNNIVFVFPDGMRIDDMTVTAAQESAHGFGLSHTTDSNDVMYPTLLSNPPDGFGAGNIPSGEMSCSGASFQDSDQMMMDTLGFRGQDTIPPAVNVTSPTAGSAVAPGSELTATATDNTAVVSVEFVVNGEVVATKTSPPYEFTVPNDTAPGDGVLSVRAKDAEGNEGSDRVLVYILSGDEQPCDNGECPKGMECSNDICIPDNGIDGELGDVCESNEDCVVGACAALDDEKRCSVPCSDEEPCPSGFECRGGAACWPSQDGGGCSAAGGGRGAGPFGLGLALLALALLGRRRS